MRPIRVWGAVALLAVGVLGGWLVLRGGDAEELPIYWQVPDFTLVDQRADTLRASDLEGTIWVTSFIFTNCSGVCPLITTRMAGLRDFLLSRGLLGGKVRLVSISVDPARDTPEVLREFAARYGGSPPSDWAFLTGSPPEAVRTMIQEGFKVTASLEGATADTMANYQVNHTPRLMLVDGRGRVRGTYDATEPAAMERLRTDLQILLGEEGGNTDDGMRSADAAPRGGTEAAPEYDRPHPLLAYAAPTLAGDTMTLDRYPGDALLVNVWATWCPPCREEMPALQALHEEREDEGLRVVGVSIDGRGSKETVREFLAEYGISYTILHDPDERIMEEFRILGIPTSYLLDRSGRLVKQWFGYVDFASEEVRRRVRRALETDR